MDLRNLLSWFALCFCFSRAKRYEIIQSENVVLGRDVTLSINIPNMMRPLGWKCKTAKYECDLTCAEDKNIKVTHNGNMSTIFIRNVTKQCLTWDFEDNNVNGGRIHLERNNEEPTTVFEANGSGTSIPIVILSILEFVAILFIIFVI
ncbi:uncharacterized protein LOC106881157 isoform X2 [Octopus bimaculoides]|nr:uncharacterized protein LOC106881157 isoform X2 [Octopus bimaculoides]XP_014786930.1 uncharacterized protein LOC106881157 isoform X2 [Octopus bimaculoides]XP_014786932.1 uncharacterized protein LOC106881157 isoform X2 [Octopus bimaculoides]XP_052825108.1 uncharacterized protein LOC106881157 isoform X2 [Octopus bimaculoides]|eukprot:XP_014786929.1 PREDICTED: uncharacterized protein LOC106881157 isoform X2 [Octopus bimaculoides]